VIRLLAATIAVAASIPTVAGGAATTGTAPCRTAGLVVWLDTQGNGAAGSSFYQLRLTNLSGHSCTLFGYPGVSAVDLTGHQLGRAASRNPAHHAHRVTLANGATASATVQIVEAGNFPPAICRQVTAAGLRVYPPNQTAAKIVPFPFSACSRVGPTYLSVQAVQSS